ncbi:RES family NAD+ phosphorylase [Marinomonas communis]|uniref:RES family NAD+ phosphorylase n=1 Tax=Marinomonas communis TaxID=28254 RepID=UPI0010044B3B|nr:RES family NAD+ phosphorylase [Marinomonas communis]MCC4276128.1 RES family NAD+ phosphorylase [Marinomonas communis]RUM58102.1 MAG: RES domain-containing protein [Marinomonas sp.]
MKLFRLCRLEFSDTAFDGYGARTYGGRWNPKGTSCAYLGESKSVCLLETVVHLHDASALDQFAMLSIEVPDQLILKFPEDALPKNWQAYPAPPELADLGAEWLDSQASLILLVPSVISGDYCALLNPNHPRCKEITSLAQREAFRIDQRLIKET